MVKFLRRTWNRYSKLGKGRKKKQVWRRPSGRDNKMRERRRGYPARVSIGYKNPEKKENHMIIKNLNDFKKIEKNSVIIIGHIGMKKKIEIAKKALEGKIEIANLNVSKFLKEIKK